MSKSLEEILEANPEAKRLYEDSSVFRMAVDDITECFKVARETLDDEDYLKFLTYGLASAQEWK